MGAVQNKLILVIEDDAHIAEGIRLNLKLKGHEVYIAPDGPSGLRLWKELNPDLILLDIMLPGIDGLSVLRNIRIEDERVPILILSAKGSLDDKIEGLTYGVDDYLCKPFNLDEFLLRVERLLIRGTWSRSTQIPASTVPKTYAFGKNVINFSESKAHCSDGRIINLTEQEIKLLKLFITNRGKPLSRAKLLEIGWSYNKRMATRTVDNFIVRIRKYFEKNPKQPVYFKSIRSVGYIFDHQSEL
jgi:DNA-binding response OmpR family regulator